MEQGKKLRKGRRKIPQQIFTEPQNRNHQNNGFSQNNNNQNQFQYAYHTAQPNYIPFVDSNSSLIPNINPNVRPNSTQDFSMRQSFNRFDFFASSNMKESLPSKRSSFTNLESVELFPPDPQDIQTKREHNIASKQVRDSVHQVEILPSKNNSRGTLNALSTQAPDQSVLNHSSNWKQVNRREDYQQKVDVIDLCESPREIDQSKFRKKSKLKIYEGDQGTIENTSLEEIEQAIENVLNSLPKMLRHKEKLVREKFEREKSKKEKQMSSATQNQRNCIICFSQEIEIVLVPCLHLCSCDACSKAINECPVCRKPIQSRVKVYMQYESDK